MRKILLTLLTTLLCSVTAWTATETLTWSGTSLTGSGGTNTSAGTAAPVNGDTYKAGTLSISSSTIATESKKHSTDSYWEDFTCDGCATEAGAPDPTATARIEFPITINSGYSFTVSSVSFNLVQQGGGGPAVHVFLVQGSTATWIGYTTPASPKSITSLSTEFSAGSAKLVFVLGLASNLTNGRGFKFSSLTISGTSAASGGSSCSAPTSPSISGTAAYTAGNDISLIASATGTSGTTTYTWYKGANWATASASSPVQATSTSGATFTKASCSMSDAGTYWCNISNGTGCDVQVSKAITVSCKNPTQTFSNSDYTVGGAALNLASKFSSNSSGAVTYSVQNAGGTGASIAGTSFSATTEGTATVRASQDANGDYCAKTIDASVSVTADDCTDPGLTITLN